VVYSARSGRKISSEVPGSGTLLDTTTFISLSILFRSRPKYYQTNSGDVLNFRECTIHSEIRTYELHCAHLPRIIQPEAEASSRESAIMCCACGHSYYTEATLALLVRVNNFNLLLCLFSSSHSYSPTQIEIAETCTSGDAGKLLQLGVLVGNARQRRFWDIYNLSSLCHQSLTLTLSDKSRHGLLVAKRAVYLPRKSKSCDRLS